MNLRKADFNDLEGLFVLIEQLFSIEEDFIVNKEKQVRGLKMLLESNSSVIFVMEDNEKIIGMVTAQMVISTSEGALSGLVEDMVVDKSYRGRGIGKQLIDKVVDWCVSSGCTRVQLLADKTNLPALKFYNGNNWAETNMICLRKKSL